jgi:hypothetical protein
MAVTDMGTTVGYATSYGSVSGFGAAMQVKDGRATVDGRAGITALLTAGAAAASSASAMSSMAGPGGAWAGAAFGVVNTMITGGLAGYDATKALAALREVLTRIPASGTEGNVPGSELDTVRTVVEFCIKKQTTKQVAGFANASGAAQPLVAAYRGGHAIGKWVKGTKGVEREATARQLVDIAQRGSPRAAGLAREVVRIVLSKNLESAMIDSVANAMKS